MAMTDAVTLSLIAMIGTVVTSALSGLTFYLVAKVNAKARIIEGKTNAIELKVDGQLTEVIALRDAVAFGKGEDKQRDKQETKEAGIKKANGH